MSKLTKILICILNKKYLAYKFDSKLENVSYF